MRASFYKKSAFKVANRSPVNLDIDFPALVYGALRPAIYNLEVFGFASSFVSDQDVQFRLKFLKQQRLNNEKMAGSVIVKASSSTDFLFFKVLVIRGIGYRFHLVEAELSGDEELMVASNARVPPQQSRLDTNYHYKLRNLSLNWNELINNDFSARMYLSVSAGHDYTCTFCIPTLINVRVTKKNRRLLIYGPNKNLVMLFANQIYKLRPPSAYTGRGVRQKRIIVVRKKTKKQRKTKRGKSTQY